MRWGLQPITYGLTWQESLAAVRAVDSLGFDYLWGHDHLWSTGADPLQPFFEGWTALTAWAALTERVRLGLLVGANPFRNPGLVAKMAATVDHVSGGRLVLGLGAGNREAETRAHGLDPGASVGERLDWLDGALTIIRGLLAGETVTHHGERYHFDGVAHAPRPLQARVPIVIGASGERKGLRLVARHADIWHQWLGHDQVDVYRHKSEVLDGHLDEAGRARAEIERHVGGRVVIRDTTAQARQFFDEQVRLHGWGPDMTSFAFIGTPEQVAAWVVRYRDAGAGGFSGSVAAPLDLETIERLAGEVRPLVDGA